MTGAARTLPPLHVVTDDRVLAGTAFVDRARAVIAAGGPSLALHVRGPGTGGRALHDLAGALLPAARSAGALLFVNDRVDVAAAVGADGVQLGRRSLPVAEARRLLTAAAWVGASVHGLEEAVAAADAGADFLVAGTIFATSSHPGREPAGTGLLSGVRDRVAAPLIGIGGVGPERVADVLAAGASGVAVLSGVWDAGSPAAAVARYLDALGVGPGRSAATAEPTGATPEEAG